MCCDMPSQQNCLHDTRYDLMLRDVACNTPPNGTGNKSPIEMALQGRPAIGLFTVVTQRHVAQACHTRGPNVQATFCLRDMLHEFKQVAASNCIKTFMPHTATCCGDVSRQHVTAEQQVALRDRPLGVYTGRILQNKIKKLSHC